MLARIQVPWHLLTYALTGKIRLRKVTDTEVVWPLCDALEVPREKWPTPNGGEIVIGKPDADDDSNAFMRGPWCETCYELVPACTCEGGPIYAS